MTLQTSLLSLAALMVLAPLASAKAHDVAPIDRHERDHIEHRQEHSSAERAHEAAHDEGFDTRGEHRAYHHARRHAEHDFHEDHPGTNHTNYRWWRNGS